MSTPERRRHPRVQVDLLVQYRADTFEDFEVAYVTDLSESGLFLASPSALAVGAMVHFQFVLREGTQLIEGLGRVVHVTAEGGMGVVVEAIDDAAREALRGAIRSRLGGAGPAAAT